MPTPAQAAAQVARGPVKRVRPRRGNKDPDMPKRAMSAYMLYNAYRLPELKKAQPGKTFVEISKFIAAEWKSLGKKAEPFEKEAAKLKKQYRADYAKYEKEKEKKDAAIKASGGKLPSKKKGRKDKNAPKRPQTAYHFFGKTIMEEMRKKNPAVAFGEINRVIATKWKALSDKQKAPYAKQAKVLKVKYDAEMATYRAQKKAGVVPVVAKPVPAPKKTRGRGGKGTAAPTLSTV